MLIFSPIKNNLSISLSKLFSFLIGFWIQHTFLPQSLKSRDLNCTEKIPIKIRSNFFFLKPTQFVSTNILWNFYWIVWNFLIFTTFCHLFNSIRYFWEFRWMILERATITLTEINIQIKQMQQVKNNE